MLYTFPPNIFIYLFFLQKHTAKEKKAPGGIEKLITLDEKLPWLLYIKEKKEY